MRKKDQQLQLKDDDLRLKDKEFKIKDKEQFLNQDELKFKNDYCNACAPTCNFSVIESKMHAEDKLLSKFSK